MTLEQIAIRQEIRQLLNEAGFNKNTMKDIVREVIDEELAKATKQIMYELGLNEKINNIADKALSDSVRKELRASIDNRVNGIFSRMRINVTIDPDIK